MTNPYLKPKHMMSRGTVNQSSHDASKHPVEKCQEREKIAHNDNFNGIPRDLRFSLGGFMIFRSWWIPGSNLLVKVKALQSISLCLVFCQLDFPVTDILYLIFCTSVVTRETWKSYILRLRYCCGQQRTKPTDSWRAFSGFAALLTRPATDRNLSLFCQHSLPFIVFKRSPLHFYQLN